MPSDGANAMEIHLVGPTPPPYGGVSVHIARLRKRLLDAGHRCTVWSKAGPVGDSVRRVKSRRDAYRALTGLSHQAIVHSHEDYLLTGLVAARRPRVVFTMHNERINLDLRGGRFPVQWGKRCVARRYFRKVPRVIAISEWVRAELEAFGFQRAAVPVVCSYLRPDDDEAAHPDNLEAFEPFRQRFGQLVSSSAWALKFHRGADMYGIDLCVEMLGRLKDRHPDLGLVLVLPSSAGTPYLAELKERATRLGVGDRVLWLFAPGAYFPIQRRCELFVRATNTDGFGVTMAEAMEFGVPVIASDAVQRPAGCVLFRNRDAADLAEKVSAALADLPALREKTLALKEPDHFEEILAVYRSFGA